jgi:hypothetical protein
MAVLLCGMILWLAALATRDCALGPYLAANCLGLFVSHRLGLAFTPLLRSVVLEIAGLALVAGLYLTLRWVLPRSSKKPSEADGGPKPKGASPER